MGEMLPTLYIARHGGTAWSLSDQHTGLTDLPWTERGQATPAASVTSSEDGLRPRIHQSTAASAPHMRVGWLWRRS
jgi:broad specificity phosphatase PhoE